MYSEQRFCFSGGIDFYFRPFSGGVDNDQCLLVLSLFWVALSLCSKVMLISRLLSCISIAINVCESAMAGMLRVRCVVPSLLVPLRPWQLLPSSTPLTSTVFYVPSLFLERSFGLNNVIQWEDDWERPGLSLAVL